MAAMRSPSCLCTRSTSCCGMPLRATRLARLSRSKVAQLWGGCRPAHSQDVRCSSCCAQTRAEAMRRSSCAAHAHRGHVTLLLWCMHLARGGHEVLHMRAEDMACRSCAVHAEAMRRRSRVAPCAVAESSREGPTRNAAQVQLHAGADTCQAQMLIALWCWTDLVLDRCGWLIALMLPFPKIQQKASWVLFAANKQSLKTTTSSSS